MTVSCPVGRSAHSMQCDTAAGEATFFLMSSFRLSGGVLGSHPKPFASRKSSANADLQDAASGGHLGDARSRDSRRKEDKGERRRQSSRAC